MVVQNRQHRVRDFDLGRPRFWAGPLEVLAGPGPEVEVRVRMLFCGFADGEFGRGEGGVVVGEEVLGYVCADGALFGVRG